MLENNHVGFRMEEVGKLMKMSIYHRSIAAGLDQLVVSRGWILGYLKYCEDERIIVCQKDLEKIFHMPKSTTTDLLTVMEKKGYIERVAVKGDARRKQIVLTAAGETFWEQTEKHIDGAESKAIEGLTNEELDILLKVIEKMKSNLVDDIDEYKNKD